MPAWVSDLLQSDRLLTVVFVFFIVGMVVKSALKAWPFLSKFVGLVHTLVGDDDNPGIGARLIIGAHDTTIEGRRMTGIWPTGPTQEG